jgi:hypothetical protein
MLRFFLLETPCDAPDHASLYLGGIDLQCIEELEVKRREKILAGDAKLNVFLHSPAQSGIQPGVTPDWTYP